MKKEETKYCEECHYCKVIEYVCGGGGYNVSCSKRSYRYFDDAVIYCKYKKLKKEKKKKC